MDDTNSWEFFAENGIISAKKLLGELRLSGEVAFHCQQAIEKYFKAYLFRHNMPIVKIHDLLKLYGEVKTIKDWNLDYTESRYPVDVAVKQDGSLPTMEEAKSYLEFAEEVESVFRSLVAAEQEAADAIV